MNTVARQWAKHTVAMEADRLWLHRRTVSGVWWEQRMLGSRQTHHVVRRWRQRLSVVRPGRSLSVNFITVIYTDIRMNHHVKGCLSYDSPGHYQSILLRLFILIFVWITTSTTIIVVDICLSSRWTEVPLCSRWRKGHFVEERGRNDLSRFLQLIRRSKKTKKQTGFSC